MRRAGMLSQLFSILQKKCQLFILFFWSLFFVCFCCPSALANAVTKISGETSDERTQISFDAKERVKYSTSISKDGTTFILYIHDIDNPKLKFGKAEIKKSSVISKVQIRRAYPSKNDLYYEFKLKSAVVPKVYNVRVNGAVNRLVLDFPHTEQVHDAKNKTVSKEQDKSQVKQNVNNEEVKNITNTRELEAALFSDLNGAGDGVNNVRPDTSKQVVAPLPADNKKVTKVAKPYIVVVDPGHGGKDPGAVGVNGLYEKKVTLSIGQMLVSYINSNSKMRGYLTRSKDRFIELGQRSEIARKYKANILISIHADSASNSQAQGASVLVLSNKRANRENSKLEKNKDKHKTLLGGAGEIISNNTSDNPYFAAMILDLTSDNARTEGFNLATDILSSLKNSVPLHHSTPIHRSLAVLKAPDIPSLLIETGYLSNREEAKLLATERYRQSVAYSIYLGIKKYIEKNPMIIHDNETSSTANKSSNSDKGQSYQGELQSYKVTKGDTLTKIATKFGISTIQLKKINNMKTDVVMLGQTIKVPRKK